MKRDQIAALFVRREADFAKRDAVALARDYADDAVIYSPTSGVHSGREAAQHGFEVIFNAFGDITRRTERIVIDGDRVAEVVFLQGTNLGGLMHLPPSGKHFEVPAVFVYELRDGKIARERRIYDFTGLLVQVGALKARPA
jgi:steroid delta-isomerase-like uncharacterized protein